MFVKVKKFTSHKEEQKGETMKHFGKYLMAVILIGLVILCGFGIVSLARPSQTRSMERYYTSICIKEGDTLWNLEEEYNNSDTLSKAEYISELKTINHLKGDTIHAGNYLVVFYFAVPEAEEA